MNTASAHCGSCGGHILLNERFCANCGASTEEAPANLDVPQLPGRNIQVRKSPWLPIIVGAVAAVALAAWLLWPTQSVTLPGLAQRGSVSCVKSETLAGGGQSRDTATITWANGTWRIAVNGQDRATSASGSALIIPQDGGTATLAMEGAYRNIVVTGLSALSFTGGGKITAELEEDGWKASAVAWADDGGLHASAHVASASGETLDAECGPA